MTSPALGADKGPVALCSLCAEYCGGLLSSIPSLSSRSKRLYSITFEPKARGIEADALCAPLNLHLKQIVCKCCLNKVIKHKVNPDSFIRYDDAAVEILHHLFGVTSTPASLVTAFERCLANVLTAQLPSWAQTLSSPPGVYVEPPPHDWAAATAAATTPEALRELIALADARQKARDAARDAQRAAVAAASAAIEALDKAAAAEAAGIAPLREELRKAEKGAKRKRLLQEMEDAKRQKEDAAARAAELEETARRMRAAVAALAE